MTIEWNDVIDIAPELSTVSTASQTALITDAYVLLNVGTCGERLDMCAKYLCAHQATLNARRGQGGTITGQSVGQVSRQFSANPTVYLDLESTSYGRTLQRLIRTNSAARWTVA